MRARTLLGLLVATLAVAPAASAQEGVMWRQGTSLGGFVGGATASSDTRGAAGASLGWEITPRLGVEGNGLWLQERHGAGAFAATIGTQVRLLPPQTVAPYVTAGVGMYRATFDRMSADVPGFYGRRMNGMVASHTFDDFAVSLGGGADVFLQRHLALRPDVRVLLVRGNGDTRAVTVYGVSLAYHFESHPITPRVK